VKAARLLLQHDHPQGNSVTASVDVTLVLRTIGANETRIGEWLNIIGYVQKQLDERKINDEGKFVAVQALLVWSAGSLNVKAYEESLDRQIALEAA
jgi:hypothetical protein